MPYSSSGPISGILSVLRSDNHDAGDEWKTTANGSLTLLQLPRWLAR